MILGYIITIKDPSLTASKALIDRLFEESKDAPRIFTYALRQISQHFTTTNQEDEFIYMAEKCLPDPRLKQNMVLYTQMNDCLQGYKRTICSKYFRKKCERRFCFAGFGSEIKQAHIAYLLGAGLQPLQRSHAALISLRENTAKTDLNCLAFRLLMTKKNGNLQLSQNT
jgi:hypothetical protein